MQRTDSPASSLRSQEAGPAPKQPSGPSQKAAYRLFPAVEPTPPASPVSLQKATLSRGESVRRRSSSLDDTARVSAPQQHYGLRQLHAAVTRKGRKMSVTDLKPMSTVQEQPLDSPTVPSRFTFKSVANSVVSDDSFHGRSSSAPSEFARDSPVEQDSSNATPPVWMNRQAAASSQTLHGLGLTIPPTTTDEQTPPPAKRQTRQKPNLKLNLHIRGSKQQQPDRPPPPPPKSPRHHARNESAESRNESAHSRTSSAASRFSSRASSRASNRDGSPIEIAQSMAYRAVAVKPTFVTAHSRESSRARESSTIQQPPVAEAGSRMESESPAAIERGRARKPLFRKAVPAPPTRDTTERPLHILPLPASKFSSPAEEPSTEGERTPRAVGAFSEVPNVGSEAGGPLSRSGGLRPPTADSEDAPPPTPLKDSFHTKKRSDESNKSSKQPPPTPLKDAHHTPPKQPETQKHDSARQYQTVSAQEVLKPELPKREAPPRPPSPSTTTSQDQVLGTGVNTLTTELPSRAPTPEPKLMPSRDRPTPELPFRSATPDLTATTPVDPMETLRNLSKQTEALHARYASLRSDRQKLSTSIVSSLKDQKAGPEYSNTMLDQHLSLAAINSSMDICFAKLKSLECRKEEATSAVIAKEVAKRTMEKVKKPTSLRSTGSLRELERSGRSTPDLVETGKAQRSGSKLRKQSTTPEPNKAEAEEIASVKAAEERKNSSSSTDSSEKRNTMIKSPPADPAQCEQPTEEPEMISSSEIEEVKPKKFRVKGAKAAKILGLMKDATERPGSPGITLPDEVELVRTLTPPSANDSGKRGPVIELRIPTSPLKLGKLGLPPPSPAPTTPLPTPPSASGPSPALPTRKDTKDTIDSSVSVTSSAPTVSTIATADDKSETPSRAGSSAESSAPEEPEVQTPSEEKDEMPLGLKSTRRDLLQTIEIHVDDEILDYYHSAGTKSIRQSPEQK